MKAFLMGGPFLFAGKWYFQANKKGSVEIVRAALAQRYSFLLISI